MAKITYGGVTVWDQSAMDMVNKCLISIGEEPYEEGTSFESLPQGTDADIAKRQIIETMIETQSKGWFFNTLYNYKLIPDPITKEIIMDEGFIRVDFNGNHQYQLFGNKVFDLKNKTYLIDTDFIEADVIFYVDYGDLPSEAYQYIALRAARKTQSKLIGAVETDGFTARDEKEALIDLQRRQMQSQDYDIRNSKVSTRIHNGYLVEGLYGNKGRRGI